jgi:hypothetical protein
VTYNGVYALPTCAWDDTAQAYIDVGCGDDGGAFVLAKFPDKYCQTPTGGALFMFNTLDNLNKNIAKMAKQCESAHGSSGNNGVLGDLL